MKSIDDMTLGLIGAGNMAEAIVRGLMEREVISGSQLVASDPSGNRRTLLENQFKIRTTTDNHEILEESDVIILAVKPQIMNDVLQPVTSSFRPEQLVISIAAGIRTEKLDALCGGTPAIIRVMPNTPALIGKGVSALCAGPRAAQVHMNLAETLFSAVGSTLRVKESDMDAVTAISGSGPAYVFYWMESMLKAAAELGFDTATARQLVYETISGSSALAAFSSENPEVLRSRVTSKGGTTEAAMNVLDGQGVQQSLIKAIHAATERSRELSHT